MLFIRTIRQLLSQTVLRLLQFGERHVLFVRIFLWMVFVVNKRERGKCRLCYRYSLCCWHVCCVCGVCGRSCDECSCASCSWLVAGNEKQHNQFECLQFSKSRHQINDSYLSRQITIVDRMTAVAETTMLQFGEANKAVMRLMGFERPVRNEYIMHARVWIESENSR